MTVQLKTSAQTNVGRVRENNEDSIHLWASAHMAIGVVADGMGGAAAGEEASRIAIEAIQQRLLQPETTTGMEGVADDKLNDMMTDAVRVGNLNIVRRAAVEPDLRGMGTTITLAIVRANQLMIAHVGDSRAYLIDGTTRRIKQVTHDHSFVEALIAAGHLTRDQAEHHPMTNILYRALGQNEDLEVDLYHETIHVGDRIVLCSDGLTRHVKTSEIGTFALLDDNPERIGKALIDLANERGGEDNISVVVMVMSQEKRAATDGDSTITDLLIDSDETLALTPISAPGVPLPYRDKPIPINVFDTAEAAELVTPSESADTVDGESRDPRTPNQ